MALTTNKNIIMDTLADTYRKMVTERNKPLKPAVINGGYVENIKEEPVVKPAAEDFDRLKLLFQCKECASKNIKIRLGARDRGEPLMYYVCCEDCMHDAWISKELVEKKRDEYEASLYEKLCK